MSLEFRPLIIFLRASFLLFAAFIKLKPCLQEMWDQMNGFAIRTISCLKKSFRIIFFSESTQKEQQCISVFTAGARHDLILCLSKTVSLLYIVFISYKLSCQNNRVNPTSRSFIGIFRNSELFLRNNIKRCISRWQSLWTWYEGSGILLNSLWGSWGPSCFNILE